MPVNFPNTWGVKRSWSISDENTTVNKKKEERVNNRGYMKCPVCHQFTDVFYCTSSDRYFGSISKKAEIHWSDPEPNDDLEITCPRCNAEVFDSDPDKLEAYYNGESDDY